MPLLPAMLLQAQAGKGAEVAAPAVPQHMPALDQPQDHLSTPPRKQTSNHHAPVLEHGQSSDPNTASFSRSHETAAGPFTNVEEEPLGGSFNMSPPGSTQAPPAGKPSGSAEDPTTLTTLSYVVSTLVHKVNSLETKLKDHKKLFKDVVGKLVKKVKAMEVKLKTKKRKMVVSDSDPEEGGKPDVDLDALRALANADVTVDSNLSLGGASTNPAAGPSGTSVVPTGASTIPTYSPSIPADVPSSVAPAGVSSKGKSPMVETNIPVKARTFKQMEEDRLDTFINGLTFRHRDTINAAAGGTFMKRRPEECYDLIENMTAHHNDWDNSAQRSESSSSITSSSDQEIVALKAKMEKINKKLMKVLQINQQVKAVTPSCDTYGGPHSYNDCPSTVGQTQNIYAMGAYQGGNSYQPQGSGTLPSNTVTNPKEDLNGITTRSGNSYQGPTIPNTFSFLPNIVERDTDVTKDMVPPTNNGSTKDVQPLFVQIETPIPNFEPVVAPVDEPIVAPVSTSKPNQKSSIPYPSRLHDQKLRDKTNDQKEKKFKIFQDLDFNVSFADVLILMPKFRLAIKSLLTNKNKLMDECLALADLGQEVLGFSDVIVSGNPTPYYDPIISTSSPTLIPFGDSDFLLEEVDAFLALEDDSTLREVDHSYYDPEGDILLLEAILNDDPTLPPLNQGIYLPQVRKELKIYEAKNYKSSIDEPPEVELKDLPPYLEYAFLESDDKLPAIISKDLSVEEKAAIIKVLKSHKQAIAWKLSDIKGINLEFCTHKILMEDDFEPVVQHQRRVNPKIHDVIKKEVLKHLDAELIYPISNSHWVSPVHCVLKKGGFTVVENEENELIPTRLVTGWRVCIDYHKLNESTRKDHFPLPFMDQMLERLAGNDYYCFLDGTFQRCMMAIFHDMIEKTMEVFMDDFSVFGNSFGTCISHLEKMLKRCEDTNICLNWEKSHFMVKEGIFLGHKISKNGIEVDKAKGNVIVKLPHPTTVKRIRSFLGHAGFYRRFIQDFLKIARPMTCLLEKDTSFFFSNE
nr:retrovirus-related Pol polyprotein [Tanacetum cinerariifolium]